MDSVRAPLAKERRTRMIHVGILAASLAMSPWAQAQSDVPSSEIVVIDGKKNPSQLPAWVVWEHAFVLVAGWKGRDSGFTHDLRTALSAEEFGLLEREAAAQSQRTDRAAREAEPLRELYANRDPKDSKLLASLNDRMQDVNIRYRRATLEARNRVLEALRPESQSVLASWIGEIRADIVSKVPKSELERWRAPE
jgi:hypothetical protein